MAILPLKPYDRRQEEASSLRQLPLPPPPASLPSLASSRGHRLIITSSCPLPTPSLHAIKLQRRQYSTKPVEALAEQTLSTAPTLTAAASSSSSPGLDATNIPSLSLSESTTVAAAEAMAQLGNWPSDYAIRLIELAHEVTGMPYWATIVGATLLLRLVLTPFTIMTAQNSARMTLLKPELDAITERMKKNPPGANRDLQKMYQREMLGLFEKYNCKPLRSFVGPFANLAMFVPMFFGLRRMGEYIPDLATGGALWFMDLGAADPTYLLPGVVTASFLVLTEVGMDGMKLEGSAQMKLIFRVMPVIFLPVTIAMPAGCLLYWFTSNCFAMCQTLLMRNPTIKKKLHIPEIPSKLQPNLSQNPFKKLMEQFDERKKSKAIADAEILHGRRPPPPPGAKTAIPVSTYAQNPKHQKRRS